MNDDAWEEEIAKLREQLREALDGVIAYQHVLAGRVLANSAALDAVLCAIKQHEPTLHQTAGRAFMYAVEGLIDSTAALDARMVRARDERIEALQLWLPPRD